jgi:glycosyltransferase involved in cell wall biosynthesis
MTSQLLSIIMPAYNSAKTIAQSVESIVTQELSIPFELVIADDASGDETPALISTFQKKYKNIITLRNETNLGGGATRNKAIAFAKGDLLICLDSDDIMPPGMLEKMVRYLVEKDADGVLFEESRSFISNKSLTMSSKNPSELIGKKITFADLLTSDSFLTQVNFLYTRAAFNTVGGYPTTHGFDTQTFGHKFLALGLSAFICPDTFYYHRQGYGKSYFEREYETGALSRNYYYLLEEILYTFTPTVVESIFA